ncbi:polymer-forming cytoskeletal protein [Acidovorax sp. CCYZU-2555]|uniref:bactofilin family protein n=1 Tax=Acidovorax sp. CCYZU-2555 TaxID=2835042 RepID=UPI001BCC89D7|nr:polymer-forming cytoskeletal protein [Acidovorax sp. CCYZU-2555]MBS7777045.1 polymer-forming cytoskeletal protein [Acidovorax sp. CCYZU-2555]
MAVQNPFFGKRENDSFTPRSPATGVASTGSSFGASQAVGQASTSAAPASAAAVAQSQGGSRLIVGPNIKLKGVEITDCDTLVVEGTVEATMDSRVIEIAEQGAFHGTAEIDVAEIRGVFDGTLIVRQKLVIYGTGKVSGKIRYGKVVIEEGGELTGQIEAGSGSAVKTPALAPSSSASSTSVARDIVGSVVA